MLKPLSATKGEILHKLLFIPFVGVGILIMAGIVWALSSIEIVGPQETPAILSGQLMSKPAQVEDIPTVGRAVKLIQQPKPTQVPTQTSKVNKRGVDCYLDDKVYRVTQDQCAFLKELRNYSLYIQGQKYEDPFKNIVDQFKKDAATTSNGSYTVDPNIAKDAQNQFDHINDSLKNITIVEHTPTPNPCSALSGSAQIVGGSCN